MPPKSYRVLNLKLELTLGPCHVDARSGGRYSESSRVCWIGKAGVEDWNRFPLIGRGDGLKSHPYLGAFVETNGGRGTPSARPMRRRKASIAAF